MDMASDDLKRKLANANGKIKEIERERAERLKVRKKTKAAASAGPSTSASTSSAATGDVAMADATAEKAPAPGELEDEEVVREREKKEFEGTIDAELSADTGASITGLFELCGMSLLRSNTPQDTQVLSSYRHTQRSLRRLWSLHRFCEERCLP